MRSGRDRCIRRRVRRIASRRRRSRGRVVAVVFVESFVGFVLSFVVVVAVVVVAVWLLFVVGVVFVRVLLIVCVAVV